MTTLQDIAPSKLKTHPANPRGDVGDITELAASIKEKGVVEPLIVAPNTPSNFVVIAGHRRLAAAKAAKLKTVPCLVRDDVTDPAAQIELMLVENLQRTDLTPIEEATAYQQLLDFPGYTMRKITATTGRSAATVKGRLALMKLPERTRSKIHSGQVSLADAAALAEFADDAKAMAKLERAIGTPSWSWYLEEERRRRKVKRAEERLVAQLTKAGVTVVTQDDLGKLANAARDANGDPDTAWLYVGEDDACADLRMPPEQHASCPGHAGWIRDGDLHYVCTRPDQHPDALTGDADDDEQRADREQREAAQREYAQQRDKLATAAALRRQHLMQFASSPEAASIANRLLRDHITRDLFGACVQVLGAMLLPDAENPTKAELEAVLTGLPLHTLAVLVDVIDHAGPERSLESVLEAWPANRPDNNYYRPDSATAAWRARLTDLYAYPWSEHEQTLLVEREPEPEPADENGGGTGAHK